jgi:tRNA U38,U39,U40 pseudouridine synthase TruA
VVRDALNAHLVPEPIAVTAAALAPEGFHARFSAKRRRYLYRIVNRIAPPALEKGRSLGGDSRVPPPFRTPAGVGAKWREATSAAPLSCVPGLFANS